MDGITLMFGVGIILFLLLYTAFSLEQKHFLLKILLVVLAFFTLILIPKTAIDNNDYCEILVSTANNSVINVTSYDYERVCFTNNNNTANTLFKGASWFARFMAAYLVIYIIYEFWGERIGRKLTKLMSRGGK